MLAFAAVCSILTGVGSVAAGASARGTAAVAVDFPVVAAVAGTAVSAVIGAVVVAVVDGPVTALSEEVAPRGAEALPAAAPAITAPPTTAPPAAAAGACEATKVSGLVCVAVPVVETAAGAAVDAESCSGVCGAV